MLTLKFSALFFYEPINDQICSLKLLLYLQDDPIIGCRKSKSRVFRDQVEPFLGIALRFKLVLLIGGVMLPSRT